MNNFEELFDDLSKTDDVSILWNNWLDWVIDQNLIINHDRCLDFKGNDKIYFKLYQEWVKIVHDELEKGDKVYICFQNKRYEYKVYSIQYENMYQTSEYMQQTQDKELTIFSCSKNRDKKEYIIVKCQYMN